MKRSTETQSYIARVKPRRTLLRNGLLSYILLSLPLFGALYYRGAENGSWPTALGVHLLSLLVALLAYLRFRGVYIGVTRTAIHERRLLGRLVVTPLSRARRAFLVETYRGSSTETLYQFLLTDSKNRRVLRMRGTFWSVADMRTVAVASAVWLTERNDPITSNVFFDEYPDSAYWFENRPALAVLAGIGVLLVLLGVVFGLMALMGIPTEMA